MKAFPQIAIVLCLALLLATCAKKSTSPPATGANTSATSAPPVFSHRAFDELLNTYVDDNGGVDYAGLKKDRAKLDQYLATLAAAQPQSFPTDTDRLAFWINGYNAFVWADVLDKVYGKVKSVQDVKGFFDQKGHQIAGADLSLQEIENRGRDLKDPRIHFAVNCASTSCPKLQRFAYNGPQLDFQLSKAGREFLGDMNRGMNYDPARNIVYLSPVFKWYAPDFSHSNTAMAYANAVISGGEMLEAAKQFMPAHVSQFLTEKKMDVKWREYDWSLNVQPTSHQEK